MGHSIESENGRTCSYCGAPIGDSIYVVYGHLERFCSKSCREASGL